MPAVALQLLISGAITLLVACVIVRDLATGTSGVGGASRIRYALAENLPGYVLLIALKSLIMLLFGMQFLHFLGLGPDPFVAIKAMI